jgi:hypothetical protein
MKGLLGVAIGGIFLMGAGGVAFATPPGPGQHFNCSDGGTTSCAADDSGCVSNTKNHKKCSSAIGKAFAKAINAVIKCHCKQATARLNGATESAADSDEEACEQGPNGGKSAKEKLDAAIAKVTPICDSIQITFAGAEESVLFGGSAQGLDSMNGNTFCDSASGAMIGGDDAGFVPNSKDNLKCDCSVAKNVGKLVAAAIKCHDKMNGKFFAGKDFDEEACEEVDTNGKAAHQKFTAAEMKLIAKGICPGCQSAVDQENQAVNALGTVDSANVIGYPCNLGSPSGAFLDSH